MKLVLRSNFRDYYDHWLDPMADHTLRRFTTDGMDRFSQLHFMERNGLTVPAYGPVSWLLNPLPRYGAPEARNCRLSKKCKKLVVYTDQRAHCGEGKLLLDPEQALADYPECLASEYIGDCPGISWRLLQVGMHTFWIEYRNNDDWRSNYGDFITFQIIGKEQGWAKHPERNITLFKLPLFAIDFALGDQLYAVDFNVAPGIRGTGVEDLLPPREAADSIKAAYFGGTYQEDVQRYYQ